MNQPQQKQRIPQALRSGIIAMLVTTGIGGGVYVANQNQVQDLMGNQYIQTVAVDRESDTAVKIAMIMGSFYESGYRHIGTPYVDKLGKGKPLTVCNGITGKGVYPNKYYTPADCFVLEKPRYLEYEKFLKEDTSSAIWSKMTDYQKATMMDFLHNKGQTAYMNSTMRSKLLSGNIIGACRENEKWNKGTVRGVSTVLPGLKIRADSNSDICTNGLG